MVNGLECGGYIQKGKSCDRPFGHIEKNIVLNIKEGGLLRTCITGVYPAR